MINKIDADYKSFEINSNQVNHENALRQFKSLLISISNRKDGDGFRPLIQYLMNDLCLVVKSDNTVTMYRIVECEVYYHDEGKNHPDPYTHKRDEQAKTGSWYFNDFGLDVTIGSEGEIKGQNIYGGILIRSIYNIPEDRYVHGPSVVLRELFRAFGSIFNQGSGLYLREVDQPYRDLNIYTTPRVNLPKKEEEYFNKPYRYLAGLTPANKVPGKEALVRQLLSIGSLTDEEISRIESMLSYKLKK